MLRPAIWRDKHNVETHIEILKCGAGGHKQGCGTRQSLALVMAQGFGSIGHAAAGFHFDKDQHITAPDNQIDLARLCSHPLADNPVSLETEKESGESFRAQACPVCRLAPQYAFWVF
jgi:hypothetical protein